MPGQNHDGGWQSSRHTGDRAFHSWHSFLRLRLQTHQSTEEGKMRFCLGQKVPTVEVCHFFEKLPFILAL